MANVGNFYQRNDMSLIWSKKFNIPYYFSGVLPNAQIILQSPNKIVDKILYCQIKLKVKKIRY